MARKNSGIGSVVGAGCFVALLYLVSFSFIFGLIFGTIWAIGHFIIH